MPSLPQKMLNLAPRPIDCHISPLLEIASSHSTGGRAAGDRLSDYRRYTLLRGKMAFINVHLVGWKVNAGTRCFS